MVLSIMIKILHKSENTIRPYLRQIMAEIDTLFLTKTTDNHTILGRTYLYSPNKGVPASRQVSKRKL